MKLQDLRLGRFTTDYRRGPKMLFIYDELRPYAAVRLLDALCRPIKAWRFMCNPFEG